MPEIAAESVGSSATPPRGDGSAPSASRRAASEEKRRRILEGARVCFGRDGYAGATVARIAAEAGVSNGLLYQFFRNKDHLFAVVLEEVMRDWVRAMVPRDAESSATEKLDGMLRRSVEFCRTTPLLPALLSRDRALQLQRIAGAIPSRVDAHRELVASILDEGIARGELQPDLDVHGTADAICVLQAEYSGRAYTDDPRFPDDPAIIDAVARMIQDAVRTR